ncbi:DUF2200 family protein [Mycolicibacterium porcinum]
MRFICACHNANHNFSKLQARIRTTIRFDQTTLRGYLDDETTFSEFFADASLNPNATLITGVVCGVKVQEIEDPLMRKIRYLDKLVDELARGKPMHKVLRTA